MDPVISKLTDGFLTKSILETRGNVSVNFQSRNYHIVTSVIFPLDFPNVPPTIKIKNIDPNRFTVNPRFASGTQPDGSVKIFLSQQANWQQHQNILEIMKQFQQELSMYFPFFEQIPQQPQGQFGSNMPNNYNPQPQPGFNQQPPYQNNPYNNYNPQQQQQQQPQSQNQFQQPPIKSGSVNYNSSKSIDSINLQIKQDTNQLLRKLQADIDNQQEYADKILAYKEDVDFSQATFNKIEEDIKKQYELIDQEMQRLEKFVQENDKNTLEAQNLEDLVVEKDPFSQQVMDLITENKAIKDAVQFAENGFKKDQINFQTFISLVKDFAEKEFHNKALLQKCEHQLSLNLA